jgi:outer membrane biosynthesis protein TonB
MLLFYDRRNVILTSIVTAGALLVFMACGCSHDKESADGQPAKDSVTEVKIEVTTEVALDDAETTREVIAEVTETIAEVQENHAEVAETTEEVKDTIAGDPCNPPPASGSLFALAGPDRETGEDIPLCAYKGGVVLIVNTAAL